MQTSSRPRLGKEDCLREGGRSRVKGDSSYISLRIGFVMCCAKVAGGEVKKGPGRWNNSEILSLDSKKGGGKSLFIGVLCVNYMEQMGKQRTAQKEHGLGGSEENPKGGFAQRRRKKTAGGGEISKEGICKEKFTSIVNNNLKQEVRGTLKRKDFLGKKKAVDECSDCSKNSVA